MLFELSRLPEYPLAEDMWDQLRREERPILVYGMGNGADKLFKRLSEYGVTVSDVFASDGFVRGHSYNGFRVRSFSEVKEIYPDFVILLSFASHREEVLSLLSDMDESYDMYIPDMPVAGEEEYFDREFYNLHYNEIVEAYESLADIKSKEFFANIINYKLSGRMCFLEAAYSEKGDKYTLFDRKGIKCALDLGAYNGDTAREMISVFDNLSEIHALEADPKTFKRLLKYKEGETRVEISAYNMAVFDECKDGVFTSSGNRNSSVSSTASFEARETSVRLVTVDSLGLNPDYIKYDVEGAELEALKGARETIEKYRPVLSVSAYHRSRDIFSLLSYVLENHPFYKVYLRRTRCVPAWEIDLIFIPT